jgi:predicted Na+-dependent transporter
VPISLEQATRVSVFIFVLTTMFSMGLSLTLEQILEPFKSIRLVALALAANFILVPLSAYLITRVVPMDRSLAIVLLVLGSCSGAPMLPKLVEFARGNLSLGVGLMILLMVGTIVYVPFVLPLVLPGTHARSWPIAKVLFGTMLPPLLGGLALRAYRKDSAAQLQPLFRRASNVALAVVVLVVLVDKLSSAVRVWNLTVVTTGALLLVLCFGFGFIFGGPDRESRRVLALGTSARNMSASFLVAVENFGQSEVLAVLAIMVLLALTLQIPTAFILGRPARDQT